MFEYWSWKERAVVIGLAALAVVLGVLVYMGMQKDAELQRLQQQASALQAQVQQKDAELQRLQQQASALQAQVQNLSQFKGAFPMYAEWKQQGQYCVLRLNILADPGVWVEIRQENGTDRHKGGYYAVLRLVDTNGSVSARGILRFTVHDPEVWFRCDQQGRAVAVEQAQFRRESGFFEYAVLINNTLKLSRFPCDGLCGLEAPLARPIKPQYVDVLVVFYPLGVNGYARIPWDYGYAARIPIR